MSCYINIIKSGLQVNVSPKVDFVEDNNGELIPPKIQGVRVIVDAMKGIFFVKLCSTLKCLVPTLICGFHKSVELSSRKIIMKILN